MKGRILKKGRTLLVSTLVAVLLVVGLALPASAATPAQIQTAIDDGLAYLAANQAGDGSWSNWGSNQVGATGTAVLAMELHDPVTYAANIQAGLDYLFDHAYIFSINPADPGAPADGDGVFFQTGPIMYETGIAMMAIAGSETPWAIVNVPTSPVNGWRYDEVMQECVDYLAWAQHDGIVGDPNARGGWRYGPNDWDSDNSVSQWPVLGLIVAEGFGCTVPAFVRSELNLWIDYIQNDTSGGSGYAGPDDWVNVAKTGALLIEMYFYGDDTTVPRVQNARDYIDANWSSDWEHLVPPYGSSSWTYFYTMYSVFKGLKLHEIDNLPSVDGTYAGDWYALYTDYLVLSPGQNADGSWGTGGWSDYPLATAWALLILAREAIPPPVYYLSLEPESDVNLVGQNHTLTATLIDEFGDPIEGEPITFTVTGVHSIIDTEVTDANGVATWGYIGTTEGTDTIVATNGGETSNDASKTWETVGPGPEPPPKVPGITGWGILAAVIALAGLMLVVVRRRGFAGSQ